MSQAMMIESTEPTAEQVRAARAFLEGHGFEFTTTALRAMALVMRGDYENEEMGSLLDDSAACMAKLEAEHV